MPIGRPERAERVERAAMHAPASAPRRVLATRGAGWARRLARALGRAGVRPNAVSISSVVFALAACGAFCLAPAASPGFRAVALLLAAATIQLRLLCNLLDGMLAVEHGLWGRMADPADAGAAVEEAIRIGNPFPQASRFVREPFRIGEVPVQPGDQVLMWLTAANRDVPGPHREPLDRFDPARDNGKHLGFGSGYHLCGGVHHVREVAVTALTTLAEPWTRFVGIDDGYVAAPAVTGR